MDDMTTAAETLNPAFLRYISAQERLAAEIKRATAAAIQLATVELAWQERLFLRYQAKRKGRPGWRSLRLRINFYDA